VGYPTHGKSWLRLALLHQLNKLATVIHKFGWRGLTPHCIELVQSSLHALETGSPVIPTEMWNVRSQNRVSTDFGVQLNNLPSPSGQSDISRQVALLDFAGEDFNQLPIPQRVTEALQDGGLPWFLFRLSAPTKNSMSDLAALFDRFLQASRTAVNPPTSALVILSCADEIFDALPDKLQTYLSADEIEELKTSSISDFMARAREASGWIREFVAGRGGQNLINTANSSGISLEFAICAAIGQPARGGAINYGGFQPRRVLTPLFWSLFQSGSHPNLGQINLVVEVTSGNATTTPLGLSLGEFLSKRWFMKGYYLGNLVAQTGGSGSNRSFGRPRAYPRLLCPILDSIHKVRSEQCRDPIIVFVNKLPFDYHDMRSHPLASNIILVTDNSDLRDQHGMSDLPLLIATSDRDFNSIESAVVQSLRQSQTN
jgi:hypothetical protein